MPKDALVRFLSDRDGVGLDAVLADTLGAGGPTDPTAPSQKDKGTGHAASLGNPA